MNLRIIIITLAIVAPLMLTACAEPYRTTQRPAPITHFVLFDLKNPADAEELIADCDHDLRPIPGIVAYAAGRHLETGRPNVESGYDVALFMGFNSSADYQRYLDHPAHVAGVAKWKPRWDSIRIFDMNDPTP